jgi:hypothetical protein
MNEERAGRCERCRFWTGLEVTTPSAKADGVVTCLKSVRSALAKHRLKLRGD